MTEDRKQELRQLLEEAMGNLAVQYGVTSLPSDTGEAYREYLQERWTYYGIDLLSFLFPMRLTLDITDEITRKLFGFMKEELVPFMDKSAPEVFMRDYIATASYAIESDPTNGSRLNRLQCFRSQPYLIIDRLLEIAFVRGIDEAVSTFDRCSRPEGAHGLLQEVILLEGIKLEKEVEVFEGVRLVPLPPPDISGSLAWHIRQFPMSELSNQVDFFRGITLLVIDRPGFSSFHKPSEKLSESGFPDGFPVDDLPFPVDNPCVKFPNSDAVNSFEKLFCQALSLVSNVPVQIVHKRWFLEEDKSFNLHREAIRILRDPESFGTPTEVTKTQIKEAKCLYKILVHLDSKADGKRMGIAIDRWIKSKASGTNVDKMIDLGIAFEALYVPDSRSGEVTYKLTARAAWYLGKNKREREDRRTEFSKIYNCRSTGVHDGTLDGDITVGEKPMSICDFIKIAQDLCHRSIMKIMMKVQNDGKLPDGEYWNSVILGNEDEQASG